jgi:hypothetical protein
MNISGFSKESLASVEQLLYGEIDWQNQFQTGKGPGPQNPENYRTGLSNKKGRGNLLISDTGVKGDMGKQKVNNDSEILSPVSYPRGPANPQSGSSKEVFGMRALG